MEANDQRPANKKIEEFVVKRNWHEKDSVWINAVALKKEFIALRNEITKWRNDAALMQHQMGACENVRLLYKIEGYKKTIRYVLTELERRVTPEMGLTTIDIKDHLLRALDPENHDGPGEEDGPWADGWEERSR